MTRRRVALLAPMLTAALLGAGASPALADGGSVGADVSFNQCGTAWSGGQDFAIVAVNEGIPNTVNRCLAQQLTLASILPGTGHPRLSVYVNTANPAPSAAAWWPSSNRTRGGASVDGSHGKCTTSSRTSVACSYVYGASLAADDLGRVTAQTRPARWWLDVEAANSWRKSKGAGGAVYVSAADRLRNRAVLEGMTARFTAAGQKVGLYALAHEFRDLIGAVPTTSALSPLPSWLAGAADQAHAAQVCSREPLAKGRVLLAQWLTRSGTDRLDSDLACTVLTPAPKPTVSGTKAVGQRLTAKAGTWGAGAKLAYRWTRDGTPITGATASAYTAVKKDAGHKVAVVVTGTRDGSSRAEKVSTAVKIRR